MNNIQFKVREKVLVFYFTFLKKKVLVFYRRSILMTSEHEGLMMLLTGIHLNQTRKNSKNNLSSANIDPNEHTLAG